MRWSGRCAAFLRPMNSSPALIEVVGAVLFGLAILHTFSTKYP